MLQDGSVERLEFREDAAGRCELSDFRRDVFLVGIALVIREGVNSRAHGGGQAVFPFGVFGRVELTATTEESQREIRMVQEVERTLEREKGADNRGS